MKKAKKPKARSEPKKAAKKNAGINRIVLIGAGIVLILIAAGIIYYALTQQPVAQNETGVFVNGEEISAEQLDFQYNLLPPDYRASFSKDEVLEQIIDEELVVQAARKEGYSAPTEEVHGRVQEIMDRNELSIQDLEKNLATLNFTVDSFEMLIGRQILIEKYLNSTIFPQDPSEDEIAAQYNATIDQYKVEPEVTVRHILISNQRDDAAVLAKEIYDKVNAKEDFCMLVSNMSDDRGSRETCGVYTFPEGYMVPEFEKASFDMKDGDVRLVQTTFGQHIIERLNYTPGGTRSLSEMHEYIRNDLRSQNRNQQYRALVNGLRQRATIEYANGTKIVPLQAGMMGAAE